MTLQTGLIVAGTTVSFSAVVPYLINTIKGHTKPRVVSWMNWSLLVGIAGAASLSDHQYGAASLSFMACIATAAIAIIGFKYGDRRIEKIDVICQIAAIAGLILWRIFDTPAIAVIASVSIDLVVGLPTVRHAWQKPHEETLKTFVMAFTAATLILASVRTFRITSLAYPLYIAYANALITAILVYRRRKLAK